MSVVDVNPQYFKRVLHWMLVMNELYTVVTEILGFTIYPIIVIRNYFFLLVVDEYHVHEGEK